MTVTVEQLSGFVNANPDDDAYLEECLTTAAALVTRQIGATDLPQPLPSTTFEVTGEAFGTVQAARLPGNRVQVTATLTSSYPDPVPGWDDFLSPSLPGIYRPADYEHLTSEIGPYLQLGVDGLLFLSTGGDAFWPGDGTLIWTGEYDAADPVDDPATVVNGVPVIIIDRAITECASELFHRRNSPSGVNAQFVGLDGSSPARLARDPMTGAREILKPFLAGGFA